MTKKYSTKKKLNYQPQPNIELIKNDLQHQNKKTIAKPVKINNFWPKTKS